MQGIVKMEKPCEVISSLKSSDIFQVEKKAVPVIHLKGIGRYCLECGKKLQPKIIQRKVNNKIINVNRGIPENRLYCNRICKNKKFYKSIKNDRRGNNIYTRINLKVIADVIPYREMVFYFGGGKTMKFKITKESKELWNHLEKLTRYKTIPKEIIICQ